MLVFDFDPNDSIDLVFKMITFIKTKTNKKIYLNINRILIDCSKLNDYDNFEDMVTDGIAEYYFPIDTPTISEILT